MISSLRLFSLAFLAAASFSGVKANTPTEQVVIQNDVLLNAQQAFDIFLKNVVDQNGKIPYTAPPPHFRDAQGNSINCCEPEADGSCDPDNRSQVNPFSAGVPDTGFESGIFIKGTCDLVANVKLLTEIKTAGQYYFYTLAGNDGKIVNGAKIAQTYQIDVNGIEQSAFDIDQPQVFNSGTGQVLLTLPAGAAQIRIRLNSNLPGQTNPPPTPKPSNDKSFVFLSSVRVSGGQVQGDPQFTGFLNQQYQIHGSDNTVYNIISSENFQYNALFKFLNEGKCREGTACFSHPGNYFGEVGIMIKDSVSGKSSKIRVISGDVETGLSMEVDGVKASIGDKVQVGDYTVTMLSQFEISVESKEFNLVLQNSDKFLNQVVSIGTGLLNKIGQYKLAQKTGASVESIKLPHGLLGQTWEANTYDNRWTYIQGDLLQYIQGDGIFGTSNVYNRF